MKRIALVISLLCAAWIMPAKAVSYCATQSWGYAGNVTGGSNTPTLVTNESQLKTALGKAGSVIIITQDITVTNHISTDKNNLTIMALPGVKLISEQQTESTSGILYLRGNNLLLRNLTFEGPGAYDCDGWDNLCLDKATNVWVDHCDFQDGCDGNFDIKGKSDNITVTWCRFRYLKEPKAGGSGGADDHRFSNLVGSGSSDKPDDGTYNITYGYCWWDEGCKQRMTRCRNALIHHLNCYWNSSVSDYYIGPENASCYFEGCTFAGKANTNWRIWQPFNGSTNYCTFVNCTGNLPGNSGTVAAPTYSYDKLTADQALPYIINSSCGAGATLNVTTEGVVSSSCKDEDPEPVIDPTQQDIVEESVFWNFSDDDLNGLGTLSTLKTVRQLYIAAAADKTMVVDASGKTLDGISFTHRLKTGGTGSEDGRHLRFDVKGDCTIDVYVMSANTNTERTVNLAADEITNVISTAPASTSFAKQTFQYSGEARRLFISSANSGINIYGVKLTYPSDPTGLTDEAKQMPKEACRKLLRDGQLLIVHGNRTFTPSGTEVK